MSAKASKPTYDRGAGRWNILGDADKITVGGTIQLPDATNVAIVKISKPFVQLGRRVRIGYSAPCPMPENRRVTVRPSTPWRQPRAVHRRRKGPPAFVKARRRMQ